MVQQPPKDKFRFKETFHEQNAAKLIWNALELVRDEKTDDAIKMLGEDLSATHHVIIKYLRNRELVPLMDASRSSILYYALTLYIKAGCYDCIGDILREVSNTAECSVALQRLTSDYQNNQALKQLMEKEPDSVLQAFQHLPKETIKAFFNEIFNIAKNEIGEKQYIALTIMQEFLDDEKVQSLFKTFSEDWDPRVRRIAINALINIKEKEDIKKLATKLLKDEEDDLNKALLRKVLE